MKPSNGNSEHLKKYQAALEAYGKADYAGAEALLRPVVLRMPRFPEAHHLLGLSQYLQNKLIEAERSIRKALSIVKHADLYLNLGLVLQKAGNADAAADAYRASLKLAPRSPKACNNLANILLDTKDYEEAIDLYRQALQADPDYTLGRKNLAFALVKMGRFDEASEIYRSMSAWGDLQHVLRKSLNWSNLASVDRAYLSELSAGTAHHTPPWSVLLIAGMTSALEMRAAFEFSIETIPELNVAPICKIDNVEANGRRLRVGYLSSDFYNHATMHLLVGVLETHDLTEFDVSVFSYSPQCDDAFTLRLAAIGVTVVDVSKLTDQQAAEEIKKHQIDILVDLKGHTGSVRLGITALRPAPIIVNWLGYPGTLGHERLADYIIGDTMVTPIEETEFFSERLALMPHCYQPNDRLRPLPDSSSRSEARLPDAAVLFCCFNNWVKFTPETFDIWSRLLKAVPNSVLWLLEPNSLSIKTNLATEWEARGIRPDRIVFAPFASQAEHTARLRLADLALDTFPCTSHTTGSDALWAGVPLVTLKGKTFAGRVAASLLTAHGFPELIAETEDDYFKLALELATNGQKRADLKQRLEQARIASPLFDTVGFTSDLEDLYRAIVADHNRPKDIRPSAVTITNRK